MIPVEDFNYTKLGLKLEDVLNFGISLSIIEIVFLLLVNQMALIAPFINFSEANIPVHRNWTRYSKFIVYSRQGLSILKVSEYYL